MNNDLANEIRSKTDIVDIIGERIPLVARGKNIRLGIFKTFFPK